MIFVVVVNFFLFHMLPGDPLSNYTRGRNVDQEQIRELRRAYAGPLADQFRHYIRNPFSGHIDSAQFGQPVWSVIGDHVWPTLLLVGTATVLSTIFGILIGIKSGWRRGSRFDKWSTGSTLVLYSMPEFWLGMILILVFANGWGPIPGLFPTSGLIDADVQPNSIQGVINIAYHLVLPVTTLTLAYLAEYSLVMRSSLLDEMGEDYLLTARAKGLRDDDVRRKHAVPNALLPSFTLSVLYLGYILSGAITIEAVFSIPGLGLLSYEALKVPDFPVLEGVFLLFSAGVIIANLIADLCYPLLDPRVRPA